MTISVQCEECFQSYKVRDERAGQTLKCKSCGCKIRVPTKDEGLEDLYEDYEASSAPTRKKKKSTPAQKKKKAKKSINVRPGNILKKIFGVLAILVGLFVLFGVIRVIFMEGFFPEKGLNPGIGFLMVGAFFSVGIKWLTDK